MSELFDSHPLYAYTIATLLAVAAFSIVSLCFRAASYGRHVQEGWGPYLSAKWSFVVMELPAPIVFLWVYFSSERAFDPARLVPAALFVGHYIYRAFVYPFLGQGADKTQPLTLSATAFAFNTANGAVNAFAVTRLAPHLTTAWLCEPRIWIGLVLFASGFWIHFQSDQILRNLRSPGETGYKIPYGGMFRWISSPNYFGEIIEWIGFALVAATLPAWVFVISTASNLVPRSVWNHRWYREKFEDYPADRKVLLPFVF